MPLNARNISRMLVHCIAIGVCVVVTFPSGSMAQETTESKSIRMTCGTCPDGYATTGITQSPDTCKDGDPVLVQCVPLGANMLAVCGFCPDGYAEIGSSLLPARCGNKDGGRLTQCQLRKMDQNFPDSTQGYKRCPPDCGSTAQPGQGNVPTPPKHQPMPESK